MDIPDIPWMPLYWCLICESASRSFHDCEMFANLRFTFVSSSSSDLEVCSPHETDELESEPGVAETPHRPAHLLHAARTLPRPAPGAQLTNSKRVLEISGPIRGQY